MFNKTYRVRQNQLAIGKLIAERILKRDPVDPHFYRPTMRPSPAAQRCNKPSGKLQGMQLELFARPDDQRPPDRQNSEPLSDLFPGA